MRLRSRLLAVTSAAVLGLTLAGCAPDTQTNGTPTTAAQTVAPSEAATTEAAVAPTFAPEGGAEENKAFFDATLKPLVDADAKVSGVTMVDALIENGFDKTAISYTADRTTIDLEAAYVFVAVKMPDNQCLVAERGSKGYVSEVIEPISTGECLIGAPLKVDW